MNSSNRRQALNTVQTVLAANLACNEADLTGDKVTVHRAEIRGGRFRFPVREQSLHIATMGRGARLG
ncbi:hypothetical protein [Paenibacillus sp. GCM10027626]|uniref:hypothetical protein n=1 Tax=Paenibacillus sp. GCM10027626 TaxID=3273411 RepID=UPI00363EEFCD